MRMSEEDYISELRDRWPRGEDVCASREVLVIAERAVADYPRSVQLLWMRGDLLQVAPEEYASQEDPAEYYRRALAIDPANAEIWEDLGYYLDALEDDFDEAIAAFERAFALGAGAASSYGLARCLAQKGDRKAALEAIAAAFAGSPGAEHRKLLEELRSEVVEGIWDPEDQ